MLAATQKVPQVLLDDARGQLLYHPAIWSSSLFDELDRSIAWRQDHIRMFGKMLALPRLTAWYGDPDAVYRYSGIVNQPMAWTPLLNEIKVRVEVLAGQRFNSVLLNRYADGQQHQGYHADDESELGPQPLIASVSFGAKRTFRLKEKVGATRLAVELEDSSLLIMAGALQEHFVHALPKSKRVHDPRINLTFRWVKSLDMIRKRS